jgi:hypothetical protein
LRVVRIEVWQQTVLLDDSSEVGSVQDEENRTED